MKNKSKLKKIRQQSPKQSSMPAEWLYMNPGQVTVKDIAEVFTQDAAVVEEQDVKLQTISTQLWTDAGILEIEIPERKSIDIESTKVDLRDEYSNAFLEEHKIQSLFFVTIDAENYEQVSKLMKQITERIGGFFCGDTEDFKPIVQ